MIRRFIEAATTISLLSIILLWGAGLGCSRSDAPQSQQPSAPVVQAPAPAPAPPQATYAPASPAPAASPQFASPSQPPVMEPPVPDPQNFPQVQFGMTSTQVRQLVGEPGKIKQKNQKVEWEYWTAQGKYEVEFINDRVVSMEKH